MNINQGHIYLANLNPIKGHEQGGYRPVLVLQNDALNKNLNTVIIVPITKNLATKGFFTTFFLDKKNTKLNWDSIALLFQIRNIDKTRLQKFICSLKREDFLRLRQQLMLLF